MGSKFGYRIDRSDPGSTRALVNLDELASLLVPKAAILIRTYSGPFMTIGDLIRVQVGLFGC
jgi:hypothetical protein